MQLKLVSLFIILVLAGVASGFALAYVIYHENDIESASYVIYTDGLTVYAKNCKLRQIQFSGSATFTIQAAINALENGGSVHIAAGTYFIDNALQIMKDNIWIDGEGWSTVLFLKDKKTSDVIIIDAVTAKQSIEGVTLSNFRVDGNRNNSAQGHGIKLNGNATCSVFSCSLLSLRIMYCYYSGIYAAYTSEIQYSGLQLGWNFNGIEIHNSSESRIDNCVVSTGYQDGIQIIDSSDIYVAANSEFQNRYGIYLNNCNYSQIHAIMYYNRQHGLYMANSQSNTIEVISRASGVDGDGLYDGICIHNSNSNIVTNSFCMGINASARERYGVNEYGTSDFNMISNVDTRDFVVVGIRVTGSNTKVNHCWNGTSWIP